MLAPPDSVSGASLAWRRTLAAGSRLRSGHWPRQGKGKAAQRAREARRGKRRLYHQRVVFEAKASQGKGHGERGWRKRGRAAPGNRPRRQRTDSQGKGKESMRRKGQRREQKLITRKHYKGSTGNQRQPKAGKAKGSWGEAFQPFFARWCSPRISFLWATLAALRVPMFSHGRMAGPTPGQRIEAGKHRMPKMPTLSKGS